MKINKMKNMKKSITICLLFFVSLISAQQIQIKGVVKGEDGLGLPGANINLKGSNTATSSDFDGKFKINAKSGDEFIVSFIGYRSRSVKVDDINKMYNIVLTEEGNTLKEVVVVTGYTLEKRSEISGAVSIVKMSDITKQPTPNLLTALQGRVAGLQINSGGTPGGSDTQIVIRGLTTVNSSSAPLWVIDGVQTMNSSGLNPDEIESIQVLKDGASAAIYGTSAANGVIVVTTKKGKKGVSEFTFKTETILNKLRDKISVLNAQQWADVSYQAQLGAGITTPTHPILINNGSGFTIPQYLDPDHMLTASDTNWVNEIISDSYSSNTDFGYRKGTDKLSLYAQVSYSEDNGIQLYTNYKRLNGRLNTSYKFFNDRLTIGENFLVSKIDEVKANQLQNAIEQNPLLPVYSNLGDYAAPVGGLQDKANALGLLWSNRKNVQKNIRYLGNVYANFKVTPDLLFNTILNFDAGTFKFKNADEAYSSNGAFPSGFTNFTTNDVDNDFLATIFTNTLEYNKTFGKNKISLLAGIENTAREDNTHNNRVDGVDITDPSEYKYGSVDKSKTIETHVNSYKISQFGSAKYVFDDKYVLYGSVRRDGSSRFGPNNRYGIFPAASAAWNVSNENFLKDNKALSNLKLRFSWGVNGNDMIGDYLYLSSYVDNTAPGPVAGQHNVIETSDYNIDGSGTGASGGVLKQRQANPDIKWETTTQYDAGFDIGFFDNRVQLTTDFYIKTTDNLILTPIALAVAGESSPATINAGSVSNKGVETVLSYKSNSANQFVYGVDLNFSKYENNVESLASDSNFLLNGVSITQKDSPIGSFYGLIADGIFRTPEEVAVHADQPGKDIGRIRYRDVNKDGKIDQKDRTIIGNPHPDFIYGINLNAAYKGFDMSLFFDGKQGNDIYNGNRTQGDFTYFGFNYGTNTLDAWTPTKANSNIPALSTLNSNNETQPSSYFVEEGSYFRLKTITLGYSFNQDVVKKFGMSNIRLYFVGQNLFSVTSFTGFDYEVPGLSATGSGIGVAGYGIPHYKSLAFGINAKF
jgi:TonB-linked SusC/RagA family outer membrane protein